MGDLQLSEFLTGDLPSWIAAVLTLCAVGLAIYAVRRARSQLTFENWIQIRYEETNKELRVMVRGVVVPKAVSFVWKDLICELMVGSQTFDIPNESIISHMNLEHTYAISFKLTGSDFPSDVTGARVKVTIAASDGGSASKEWGLRFESGRPIEV